MADAPPDVRPLRERQPRDYLNTLPEELLLNVLSHLDAKICKSLRLTSRKLCRLATASAFKVITFRICEDSIQKLFQVAYDEHLCQHVETLVFAPLERFNFAGPRDFERSIDQRDYAPRGPVPVNVRDEPRHSFSETDIERFYASYMEESNAGHLYATALTSADIPSGFISRAAAMMPQALSRLSNLVSFVMSDKDPRTDFFTWKTLRFKYGYLDPYNFLEVDWSLHISCILPALSTVHSRLKTLALNTPSMGIWSTDDWEDLWGCPDYADVHKPIAKVPGALLEYDPQHTYPLAQWLSEGPTGPYSHLMKIAFTDLTNLYLDVTIEGGCYNRTASGLASVLCCTSNVETLSLSLQFIEDDFACISWYFLDDPRGSCLLGKLRAARFLRLKDLRLRSIFSTEDTFQEFMGEVGSTLTTLCLTEVYIVSECGTWDTIFPRLPHILTSLEHIDIDVLGDDPDWVGVERILFSEHTSFIDYDYIINKKMDDTGTHLRQGFLSDAYQHYKKDMQDFLLRKHVGAQPPIIEQEEYMVQHYVDCDWCLKHADEYKKQEAETRKERNASMEAMGVRGAHSDY